MRRSLCLLSSALACLSLTGISSVQAQSAAAPEFDPGRFEVTTLAGDLQRPMELAVADDGCVYFIELEGKLRRFNPRTTKVETVGELKITTAHENGLIGIALDPNFAQNQWIYLQYSPPDYPGQHISRFTLDGDKLSLESEKLLFKFEEQRKECCHHAGSMAFGPDGCLYIGTGDNTHPHGDSQGSAPIDERPERAPWDAQKSAANTKSGSGKILRIRPTPDGGCEIPDGNLFAKDGSEGLPEIFVMGCRNPWRISVDARSGFVYWGEVGPDAGGDGPRGPRGYDEINQARAAGNFGWPYFIANNLPYHDVDFTTGKVGDKFNVEEPLNESPNNTGARKLPKPQPALLYYPYGDSADFPELNGGGGRTACAGPVYHFAEELKSETKFPKHFDGVLFIYEWSRNWIKAVHLDASGNVARIEPFLKQQPFVRPIDMQFGPDGALYLIEYGTTWGANQDARLVRIDYANGNRRPMAKADAANNVGREPLEVAFSSQGTFDKDPDDKLAYSWRAFRAGESPEAAQVISQEAEPKFTFREPGVFNVELVVTDARGATNCATVPVIVGNARPQIKLLHPADGEFFDPSQPIPYKVYVRDEEDGTSDDDEADQKDIEFLDAAAPGRVTLTSSAVVGQAAGAEADQGPRGMKLVKGSDCLNCHAINQKRVGPPFVEVAEKYRTVPNALEASVKRVREGSTGVWGKIPMIPHSQHTEDELREMVTWVYSLKADGGLQVLLGFVGEVPLEAGEAGKAPRLALEASYIDRGREGIPPLTHATRIVLRNRRVEAEQADEIRGSRVLESSAMKGNKFIGAIDHGHFVRFAGLHLDQVGSITARIASGGAGGRIEVRLDRPDGPKLADVEVKSNGQWEDWREETVTLEKTAGVHDVCFVFVSDGGKSGLMNLDAVVFNPPTATPVAVPPEVTKAAGSDSPP